MENNIFLEYYNKDFFSIKIFGGFTLIANDPHNKYWMIYLMFVNFFFPLLVNMAQVINLFQLSDLIKLASSGYIVAIACMGSFKSFLLFKNRVQLAELMNLLKNDKFLPKSNVQRMIVRKELGFHKTVKTVLLTICTMSVMASVITPVFNYQDRRLPFAAWYPFDITPMPIYVLVYIHQSITDFYNTYMNVYTDIIIAGFTTFVGIQCDILCDDFINMKTEEGELALKKCIEHHELILRYLFLLNY